MIGIYCHHTSRFQRNTGIQRCLRATARGLLDAGEAIVPLLWSEEKNGLALASAEALTHLASWHGPPADSWTMEPLAPGSWLVVVELVSGPHQPSQAWLQQLARRYCWRLAAVFHDAIPLAWGGEAAACHGAYMEGLASYDLVFATSEYSHGQLQGFWRAQGLVVYARLEILPLAAELPGVPRRWPQQLEDAGSRSTLRLLSVGSLEPRKNHRRLLQALAWLQAQGPGRFELQLVGWANDPRVVQLVRRAQGLGLPITWDAEADDHALRAYYQRCDLSVYPSLEEGFGLPVLESLWLGKPCLVGQAPALQEQAMPGGCLVVSTTAWQELALALAELQRQPQLLAQLQGQVRQRPLRSWGHYARGMLNLMERIPCRW
ncbi:glycosyltransferase [Cyanobium sp. WAJ14-Wanaka]|uniref:glycosyltransferase n=1 Tax=Cyanobium sp. WAJ14-Wanaka TaxID=2823725 RepID=UPI0020CE441B|nr:glycosyltransferase [Cyanobium sp. WAJ14-Wanaka]MCP9775633.1 glycosyltransferase [Cyanobium sp. WAJ14-Wanaka]